MLLFQTSRGRIHSNRDHRGRDPNSVPDRTEGKSTWTEVVGGQSGLFL